MRNPNGWAPGAYETFSETRKALAEANSTVSRIAAELEATRAAAAKATAEVAQQAIRHEQEMVLRDLGGNFRAASVQRMVRQEYAAYVADAGATSQPFAAWIASDPVKSDPLFAAHFGSAAAPAGPQPAPVTGGSPMGQPSAPVAQPPQPAFNAAAGQKAVGAGGARVSEWTPNKIAEYAASPGQWRENRDEVRRALEERLGVSLAPSSAKRPTS